MEGNQAPSVGKLTGRVLKDLKKIVWGSNLKNDVFRRWSQGFVMSEDEPTALIQLEGGPCAVIAPVQAFIIKNAMSFIEGSWRTVEDGQRQTFLVKALLDILSQCNTNEFKLVFLDKNKDAPMAVNEEERQQNENPEHSEGSKEVHEQFHSNLKLIEVSSTEEMEEVFKEKLNCLRESFGVVLFLYSVLLTKGIDQIKNEMEDPTEPLIDGIYGHGSQSLINVLLTGRAVSNVWDNDKDVSGLKLHGITTQSAIGFLTLLEHLRYCEVGWFLKCPLFPIWILGSETHLTVVFSEEKSLCSPETPAAAAKRIFKSFDPEGNNFISSVLLGDVLQTLELYAETEYVQMMCKKLDAEGLGIILLNDFMNEFYPSDGKSDLPESFTFYHYNGLRSSCQNGKVMYQEGKAMMIDFDINCMTSSNPVMTCLQTKWPRLEIEWRGGHIPSLN